MKRLFAHSTEFVIYAVLIALAIFTTIKACSAEDTITEERIIDLPQDSQKWFISVIGDTKNMQYRRILGWFEKDKKLSGLRIQVHFWEVPTGSSAYKNRYEHNVRELPTVRVQKPDGFIVWEGAGKEIPLTAKGLYNGIAEASSAAMAILPWRRNGTILPWRQHMQDRCEPGPAPSPYPVFVPVVPDPEPVPIDDGGPPTFEEESSLPVGVIVFLGIACFVVGGVSGVIRQCQRIYATE